MNISLDGKVSIITGGAAGIGLATAKLFAASGAKVVIADRNQEAAKAAIEQLDGASAIAVHMDAGKAEDNQRMVQQAREAFGRVDILVANAGVFDGFTPLVDTTEELWDRVLRTNLKGYFLACKATLPELIKTKGNIVMTASTAGFFPQQGGLAYTVAKHGVVGLIRELAFEVASFGVRVNGVAPGGTITDLRNAIKLGQPYGDDRSLFDDPQVIEFIKATTPLQKAGQPEEVAGAIAFLASEAASHITGQILLVDGGYSVRGFQPPEQQE